MVSVSLRSDWSKTRSRFRLNLINSFASGVIVFIASQSFDSCKGQKIVGDRIVGVSEGHTCTSLADPEHGYFKCKKAKDGKVCHLLCDKGYVLPLTYTAPQGQEISVWKRGEYRCKQEPGGLTWEPDILFDCVKRVQPSNVIFYHTVKVQQFCDDEKGAKRNWTERFLNGLTMTSAFCQVWRCEARMNLKCSKEDTLIEIFLSVPFKEEVQNSFHHVRSGISRYMDEDRRTTFNNGSKLAVSGGFYTDCPSGSLIQQDFTCRGCSKGYFMDLGSLTCKPCPAGSYQDEALKSRCKQCPGEATGNQTALQSKLKCFLSDKYRQQTLIQELLFALTSIVVVSTVILCFRGYVTNEPGPKTVEKEVYILHKEVEESESSQTTVSSVKVKTKRATVFFDTHDPDFKRKSLLFRTLPLDRRASTWQERKSLASERMLLSMQAIDMRRKSIAFNLLHDMEGRRSISPHMARKSVMARKSFAHNLRSSMMSAGPETRQSISAQHARRSLSTLLARRSLAAEQARGIHAEPAREIHFEPAREIHFDDEEPESTGLSRAARQSIFQSMESRKKQTPTMRIRRSIAPPRGRKSVVFETDGRHSVSYAARRSVSPGARRSVAFDTEARGSTRRSVAFDTEVRGSISPAPRRSISPAMRRSISPAAPRRSISPAPRRSITQVARRSVSPHAVPRRSLNPFSRLRKSITPAVQFKLRRSPSTSTTITTQSTTTTSAYK